MTVVAGVRGPTSKDWTKISIEGWSDSMRTNYDLDDDDVDLQRWPNLKIVLEAFREALVPVYLAVDQAAIKQQRRHSWLVWSAAIFGTLAVLCAICELAKNLPLNENVIPVIELIAVLAAIIAVGLGLWSAFHIDWLLKRFLSEQCRFVKFHLLLDPAVWHGRTAPQLKSDIASLLKPIQTANKGFIHRWVTWQCPIIGRFHAIPDAFPNAVATELMDYYKEKRLKEQQRYFERQAKRRKRWESLSRNISPRCFFLSIVAALAHFVFELIGKYCYPETMEMWARISILLAAALPAVAAGVRTIRSAHEFGRNQLRFEAMSHYLTAILGEVNPQTSPDTVIPMLREAEIALDAEHRAWLRLMIEAEWFG